MILKFCANIGFMFTENNANILQRYQAAAKAGFRAVEGPFPAGFQLEEVVQVSKDSGLEHGLLNIFLGDVPNGSFGITSFPNHEEIFKKNFDETLRFAKALNCKKIHIQAGKLTVPRTAENDLAYLGNLKYAVSQLENENDIIAVIEPINNYSVPGYYLNNFPQAIDIIDKINSPKLKLLLDIYHLQIIQGNVSKTIDQLKSYIGHVQIAQAPHRHEPSIEGELNMAYVLKEIEKTGYDDWIGCEYFPSNGSVDATKWIQEYGYCL